MDDLEKNIRINQLFDIYGELLADSQKKMIELYYQDDLSLGEIAEIENISRNAVHDSLKKGITALENYESVLHNLEKKEKREQLLEELKKENLTERQSEIVEKIRNEEDK